MSRAKKRDFTSGRAAHKIFSRKERKEHKERIGGRLRFGGSTSASTAGVLACHWNKALLSPKCVAKKLLGSRTKPAKEYNHKEHKETISVTLAAEASKNLLNVESRSDPLVRGRLRPPKKKPPRSFPKTPPKILLDRGRSPQQKKSSPYLV